MRLALIFFIFLVTSVPLLAFGPNKAIGNNSADASVDANRPAKYPIVDLRNPNYLDRIVSDLTRSRVIFVGEIHANYAHHLLQLAVIKKLTKAGVDLVIGMEMFQQPAQAALDRYISGEITENEMLEQTEWFDRWKYDYRLYQPVVSYAAQRGIPVVALNVPQELVARVSEAGLGGLTDAERRAIPNAIDFTDKVYQDYLEAVYNQHGASQKSSFNRFIEVQLLWDEGMAEQAADYLLSHPEKTMVVLVGSGHVQGGHGIPNRLKRRMDIQTTTILPMSRFEFDTNIADIVVFPGDFQLPSAGLLGIYMEQVESELVVVDLVEEGAAGKSGIKKDDIIRTIDQTPIESTADVKRLLYGKKPGDQVTVTIVRKGLFGSRNETTITLSLGGGKTHFRH